MVVLGAGGVVLATVPSVAKTLGLGGGAATEIVPFKVMKTKLAVVVKERGNLESAKNEDVKNEVEGSTPSSRSSRRGPGSRRATRSASWTPPP